MRVSHQVNIENISCVLIVKNASATLSNTLDSLHCFQEVIVFDNGSQDGSIDIAKQYPNVKLICGEFTGFGETKNKAASFANNDWVLSLDADEVLSTQFCQHLADLPLADDCCYQILRTNYYKDREIKYCWGKDLIVRLYNRSITSYNDNKVHEYILSDGLNTKLITGLVRHYPYQDLSGFMQKADKYSSLFAHEKQGIKTSSPAKAILNAGFSFFKTYILKRGFLDGYPGLIIAFSHMTTNFFKYMKLFEANKGQHHDH